MRYCGLSSPRVENSPTEVTALDAIPYPLGWLESILAVVVAISSQAYVKRKGIRGYFQRQFRALTGSVLIAVVLQAAVFWNRLMCIRV